MTKITKWLNVVPLLAALMFAAGCATDDTLPTGVGSAPAQPQLLVSELLRPTGLLQCRPLPYASATATIGSGGGTIRVGPHTLRIPPGALDEPVTITAEAPVGTTNLVRLQPHGLVFERPAALTMSYGNCNLLGLLLPKRIAYTSDALEILEYLLSFDDLFNKRVTGRLDHFSNYAVAW